MTVRVLPVLTLAKLARGMESCQTGISQLRNNLGKGRSAIKRNMRTSEAVRRISARYMSAAARL